MPCFERTYSVRTPVTRVFEFFRRAANLVRLAPPELRLHLLDAPELLELGSRITAKARRWGMSRRVVTEVTVFEAGTLFTETQREGPFQRWSHTRRFEPLADGGTLLTDHIDFEPPGGMLGRLVTATTVERELEWVFTYREEQLPALLSQTD